MLISRCKNVIIMVMLQAAMFGCKARQSGSTVKELSSDSKILIIASGGWMSCAKGAGLGTTPVKSWIYDSLMGVVNDIQRISNARVEYLISCLGLRSPTGSLAPLWYSTNASSGAFRTRAKDFPNVVAEYINRRKPDKVYLIGHSYGGWVISNALQKGDFSANAAFGLDFIDAQKCVVLDGLDGDYGAGCRESPDFDYSLILSKLDSGFYNYWQKKGPIHSAPVTSVTGSKLKNIDWVVSHPRLTDPNLSHRFIGFDSNLWQSLCVEIASNIGADGSSCRKIETDERGHAVGSSSGGLSVDQNVNSNRQDPIDDPSSSEGASHIICEKVTDEGIPWNVEVRDGDGDSEFVLTATRGTEQLYGKSSNEMTLFRSIGDGGVQFRSAKGTISLDLGSGTLPVEGRFVAERFKRDVGQLKCRSALSKPLVSSVNNGQSSNIQSSDKRCTKVTADGISWNISLKDLGGGQHELTASRGNERLYGSNVDGGILSLNHQREQNGDLYISNKGTVWLRIPDSGLGRFSTERFGFNVTDLNCSK
ncbi:MAG: hypothetical protein NT027_01895 [Proteobacteria bacterium]|nr:hypothetical protein [Pseudomonadota bacterium]